MAPVCFEKCAKVPEIEFNGAECVDGTYLDPKIAKAALGRETTCKEATLPAPGRRRRTRTLRGRGPVRRRGASLRVQSQRTSGLIVTERRRRANR